MKPYDFERKPSGDMSWRHTIKERSVDNELTLT